MSKFILLLGILVFVQAGLALKCKVKDSNEEKEREETCTSPSSNQEGYCLTEIYKDDAQSTTEHTVKKCALGPKDKKYECPKRASNNVIIKCETCTADLCNNAATKLQMSFVAIFGLFIAYFVPKFVL